MQLIHVRLAPLVLLEQEVLLVGAGRAVLQKQSKLVLNLRWHKRKEDSSGEEQDVGDDFTE